MEIVIIMTTVVAFFVKGVTGFANTLVFNAILSFSINNINISPVEILVGYPSNIIIVWEKRKETDVRIWLPLILLVIVGMIPGVFFLKFGSAKLIKILFGVLVIGISIEMFLREYQMEKRKSSPLVLVVIGLVAGLMSGLFGIGALLAAYIGRTTENTDAFKANMCTVFFLENTIRIIMYTLTGIINLAIFVQALKLMPFMLAGLLLGMKCSNRLPEKLVKKIVIVLLAISGIVLVAVNII